jgi:hypothetical protein
METPYNPTIATYKVIWQELQKIIGSLFSKNQNWGETNKFIEQKRMSNEDKIPLVSTT